MHTEDVVIVGAGAAGLMCAAEAGRRGRSVVVLERGDRAGRKILVSGGGRCNFTNAKLTAADYVCANPHFVKSALARFTPWDMVSLLSDHGVAWTDEGDGRLFCTPESGGAPAVVDVLLAEAEAAGAMIRYDSEVRSARLADGGGFVLDVSGSELRSHSLVVAAGGPAWPQSGGTAAGHDLARSFGLAVTEVRPGLVPLRAPAGPLLELCASLSGVSLPVRITCAKRTFEGDLLFTHRGISGLVVLDLSVFWRPGDLLSIDLLPGIDVASLLAAAPRMEPRNLLAKYMPKRLADGICDLHGWRGRIAELPGQTLRAMEEHLHGWAFAPAGPEGMARAEATLGGVAVDQFSSKTMECTTIPGLYCVGEALDVTGRLGGFNLHWAWASGHAAGLYV